MNRYLKINKYTRSKFEILSAKIIQAVVLIIFIIGYRMISFYVRFQKVDYGS